MSGDQEADYESLFQFLSSHILPNKEGIRRIPPLGTRRHHALVYDAPAHFTIPNIIEFHPATREQASKEGNDWLYTLLQKAPRERGCLGVAWKRA